MEGLLLILVIWVIVRLVARNDAPAVPSHRGRQLRLARQLPSAVPEPTGPQPEPYLAQVRTAITASGGRPISYHQLPMIPTADPGHYYFPGVREASSEMRDGAQSDFDIICAAVLAVKSKRIKTWRALEATLREVHAHRVAFDMLPMIPYDDITIPVARRFAEVAQRSDDLNAVKWGILIAGMQLNPTVEPWIAELAHYSEFTTYCCIALNHARRNYPQALNMLLDLISVTEGWGLFQVIGTVLRDPDLARDASLCRSMFLHGIENGRAAWLEIAAALLHGADMTARLHEAADDPEFADALFTLLATIAYHPTELPLLREHPHGEQLTDEYLRLAAVAAPSIQLLAALHALIGFLSDESLAWDERESLLGRAWNLYPLKMDHDVLAEAIRTDRFRFAALEIARDLGIESLVPVILQDVRRRPHPANVNALGAIGGPTHLRELMRLLVRLNAAEAAPQKTGPFSDWSEEYRAAMRATLLQCIGKLNSRTALRLIENAMHDADPQARAAAVSGLQHVPRWTLGPRLKQELRNCVRDPVQTVQDLAVQVADYHAVSTGVRSEEDAQRAAGEPWWN